MERCMTAQTYQNPFLQKSFNDVLLDQEKYLIPQNSNTEVAPDAQPHFRFFGLPFLLNLTIITNFNILNKYLKI